ncbi:hypothetical protein [Nitrospira sp. BLG_1]|uniref:hypothetical protein n=1 Tax=Nitrospira sp. BLG_1 TaxID=3395883 RepID=UPI0039BC8198
MKKIFFFTLLIAMHFIGLSGAEAIDRYVRAGATGAKDGTDWTNAYSSLPATLVRGDTYFVASGSYGSYTFDDPTNGTTLITIKKATVADHGSAIGWSDSYASGQAVWTGWNLNSSYVTIDGQTGGGPGSWDTGLGFAVRAFSDHLIYGNNTTNVTVLHTELDGTDNSPGDRDALYFISGATNLTFRYMYMHNIGCDFAQFRGNITAFTWEYSKSTLNNQASACHGDVFEYDSGTALNWVIRYSWFDNCQGTYLLGTHESGKLSGAWFYGNIVSGGFYTNGIVSALSGGGIISDLKFFNNTIVNASVYNAGFLYLERGSNNQIYNNLYYANTSMPVNMQGIHDYNWFYNAGAQSETHIQNGSGNPFINLASKDFRLLASTTSGISLASPFNIDLTGKTRGGDGIWDRGAYDFGTGGTATVPPSPTNLTVQ